MKKFLLLICLTSTICFSQTIAESNVPGKVYPISISNLQNAFLQKNGSTNKVKNLSISLPNISGEKTTYNLQENDLTSERASSVTTFDGISADGQSKLKLSLFGDHIVAVIKNDEGYFFVEPYETSEGNYRVYPQFTDFGTNFSCGVSASDDLSTELNAIKANLKSKISAPNFPYGNQLRKFRMAIATTGEFTQAFGSNQDTALAEAISVLNLINLIFESEVSITFSVISKTTDKTLIFTDPNTDPFTVDATFASAANSQTGFNTLNSNGTLLYNAYDIAHTFNIISTGGGQGQAGNVPCYNTLKARAWSQWQVSLPKSIIANLIVHEMGHQFGAGHTYNAVGGNADNATFCTSGWSDLSAVEPGAGTTIMSYGNNCTLPSSQTNSGSYGLNYFNAKSLDQITTTLVQFATCFTLQGTTNMLPTANAGADITIPKNTPFKLKGIGTDSNDTNLSYTWEQADNASANDKGAFGNSINGVGGYTANNSSDRAPLFRSFQSTATTERNFPNLQFVLNNQNVPATSEAEILPAVARTMKFRFTVRDNNALSGGVDSDEIVVTVANSGPLQVTAPSVTGISMAALSTTNITWDVNGTNALKNTVNIMLSIDGGTTYPYLLASNTTNDGSETVTIPNVPNTTTARIKVVAVLNSYAEFFDVSDTNFTITSACMAYKTFISPSTSVNVTAGSSGSNLNMTAPPAAGSSYTSKTNNYSTGNTTLNNIYTYNDSSLTTPRLVVSNYTSITYSFRVTKSGSYNFSNLTGGFLVVTIHSGSPYTLGNFVASNAHNTGGSSYSSTGTTQNMTLQEGTTYYALLCNFSNPADGSTYNISSTGPGSLYDIITTPSGYSYTFIAIDNANDQIKAASTTANFTTLPAGSYTVQGISYSNTVNSSTFINKTVAELGTSGVCFYLSENSRDMQLQSSLGIDQNIESSQTIILTPNPVSNYLTIISSQKVSDYQIFDLSGRMITRNKLSDSTINVSSLATGTYIVTLLNNGKVLHREKIIKK